MSQQTLEASAAAPPRRPSPQYSHRRLRRTPRGQLSWPAGPQPAGRLFLAAPHSVARARRGRFVDGCAASSARRHWPRPAGCVADVIAMVRSLQWLVDAIFEIQRRKKEAKMEDDQSSESSMEELPPPEHYGCKHYRRKARLVAPCCGKVYSCRFCHDDVENHELDRKTVSEVECAACGERQGIHQTCTNCDIVLAKYFCAVCRLYDDDMKQQYHCEGCGICRVGGRDSFYHCDTCDMCLPKNLENNHKCVERVSRTNCAVCMEDLHTSRISSHIPPCGHMIHKPCFRMLVDRGYYACPTCNVAMFKMDSVWSRLDQEVAETQMPARYRDCYAKIICNDCQSKTVATFHIIGLKCGGCGSYNTARGDGPLYKRNAKEELIPFSELDEDEPEVRPPPAADPPTEQGH